MVGWWTMYDSTEDSSEDGAAPATPRRMVVAYATLVACAADVDSVDSTAGMAVKQAQRRRVGCGCLVCGV